MPLTKVTPEVIDLPRVSVALATDASAGGLKSYIDTAVANNNGVTLTTMNSAINSAINNLLNGAPTALDTLNEIALAINNDASFNTTLMNAINLRLLKTGKAADSSLINGAIDAVGSLPNTIAKRDSSGDLTARQLKSTQPTLTVPALITSGIGFRTDNTSNNQLQFMDANSTRQFLDVELPFTFISVAGTTAITRTAVYARYLVRDGNYTFNISASGFKVGDFLEFTKAGATGTVTFTNTDGVIILPDNTSTSTQTVDIPSSVRLVKHQTGSDLIVAPI